MSNQIMASAKTKIYIAEGETPATETVAGYEAITNWVLIPDVTNIGELGGTNSVIQHIAIDDGLVYKVSGSTNSGTLSLQGARTKAAALNDVRAAYTSRKPTPFKIVYPDALGDVDYFSAIVTSVTTNVGNADQILGFNISVDVTGAILTDPGA